MARLTVRRMADLIIPCDCGQALAAPTRWSGRRVLCAVCRREHVVPQPPPPAPAPLGRGRWPWRRRAGRPLPAVAIPARPAPPAGLHVAHRPPHPDVVAARRARRRRRLILLAAVLLVIAGGWIGGRIAWKNYKKGLYRGHQPVSVQGVGELRGLQQRQSELRLRARAVAADPTSPAAARRYVSFATELRTDLAAAGVDPHARATLCNDLAWYLLTTPLPEFRDPETALDLARQSLAGHHRESAAHLDTYAEALFQNGRPTRALEAAREAVLREPDSLALRETFERIEDTLLR